MYSDLILSAEQLSKVSPFKYHVLLKRLFLSDALKHSGDLCVLLNGGCQTCVSENER